MPQEKKPLQPSISVGDKVVHVGPLSWAGMKDLVSEFGRADLPLPAINFSRFSDMLKSAESGLTAALEDPDKQAAHAQLQDLRFYALLGELLSANLDVLREWIIGHPPIVTALVAAASNLAPAEIDALTAGELLRVARAAWTELVNDGFFTEAAGFFGGLLGLGAQQTQTDPSQPPGSAAQDSAATASA